MRLGQDISRIIIFNPSVAVWGVASGVGTALGGLSAHVDVMLRDGHVVAEYSFHVMLH